ncbi:hypothetical protein [Streptomyces sp. RKAG293]|uniref:hypothetical protein n=1 Tax=Streptomyces sp. RKAG293 TaxID=2893403 RepID=UPI002033B0F5|nr:hypothetical protein [Streptomyces sp. RKAG293]MCM2417678.1 hypothetical protein [Streptomyces sp. RKAG293]
MTEIQVLGFCVLSPIAVLICAVISSLFEGNGASEAAKDKLLEDNMRYQRDEAIRNIAANEVRVHQRLNDLERKAQEKIDRIMGE